jgi:hypothetical protein
VELYEQWIVQRWETPVSDFRELAMVSLVDSDGLLKITLEAFREVGRPRWSFIFDQYPAYRNILEEYRYRLWNHLSTTSQRCGATFCVVNSPWIENLINEENLDIYHSKARHFILITEDDVIEVLSSGEPEVVALGFTSNEIKIPGKSEILIHPEDKEKINVLHAKLKNTSKDS